MAAAPTLVLSTAVRHQLRELIDAYGEDVITALFYYAAFVRTAAVGAGGMGGLVRQGVVSNMSKRSIGRLAAKHGGVLAPWQFPQFRRPSKPGRPPRTFGGGMSLKKAVEFALQNDSNGKASVVVGPRKLSSKSGAIWNVLEFGGTRPVFMSGFDSRGNRDPANDGIRNVVFPARPFMEPSLKKATVEFRKKFSSMFQRVQRLPPIGPIT